MDEHEYEVRLTDPGELAAGLPHLLGFRPAESVVVVGLGGESGGRVGMTVRMDIPPPQHAVPLAGAVARGIATDAPEAVLIALVSEAPDEPDLPHRPLVHELVLTLAAAGIPVREVLLIRDGRWWSYDCPDPCCAPGAGTPLPAGVSPLAAASVVTGQVVAQSRGELATRLRSLDRLDVEAVRAAYLAMTPADRTRAREDGWATVERALSARRDGAAPALLPPGELAEVLCALQHRAVRDRALGLALGADAAAAESLWTECTRRAPFPLAAPPATLAAVSAWLRGDGAMAGIALEHALDHDEDYDLARLLRSGLAACVRPEELRALIVATRADVDDLRRAG
ncbi:DUF4192 domain-containing protein [Geodermatophilus sp. SYSU D00691]